jgi:nucleoside-diphosphate-sugar epimerase
MSREVLMWPVPPSVLYWIGSVAGKQAMIDRLLGPLQVDSLKIRQDLDWRPLYSVGQGCSETAAWYSGRFPRIAHAS